MVGVGEIKALKILIWINNVLVHASTQFNFDADFLPENLFQGFHKGTGLRIHSL